MRPAIIRHRIDITPLLGGAVLIAIGMALGMLVAEIQDEDAAERGEVVQAGQRVRVLPERRLVPRRGPGVVQSVTVTTRQRAPMRDVARIIEVVGARGGIVLVHVLTCEHWVTGRKPRKQVPCIGCVVEAQVKRDASNRAASDLPADLVPDAIAVHRQRRPKIGGA